MERKVVDILPPAKEGRHPPTTHPQKELIKKPEVRISRPPFKKSLLIAPLVLIIAGIIVGLNLSRAEIEIWPETEVLTFKTKLTVDQKAKNVDFLNKVIPGQIFQAEKTVLEEFPSTGKKLIEKKAEGVIRVYNNSTQSQTLIPSRFQPPLDKFLEPLNEKEKEYPWFWSQEQIVIPPKGYKDVKVVAAAPGEKYNIKPTKFVLPAFAGSLQYTLVYGESFIEFKGGFKKEAAEVTQEDLDKAKKILEEKALGESKTALKNKIPAEFDFLEESSKTETTETFSLARPGAALEKFSYQVKASSVALVFKTSEIENFVTEFVLSQIPQQKRIDRESLKINYTTQTSDLEAGKITLSLTIEAKIYSGIDETSLKKALGGKSLTETQIFLENQPQITKVLVKFWPFWVKKVPEDIEKIEIKFNLD